MCLASSSNRQSCVCRWCRAATHALHTVTWWTEVRCWLVETWRHPGQEWGQLQAGTAPMCGGVRVQGLATCLSACMLTATRAGMVSAVEACVQVHVSTQTSGCAACMAPS